jgi:two-component system, NtrC family, response regulator GlrR
MADPLMPAAAPSARGARTAAGSLELMGKSAAIARARELVRRAAAGDGGVLLVAERGVDVASVARELHARSPRAGATFVWVECGAAESSQIDGEVFGVIAGGNPTDLETIGPHSRIAAARRGTLFLQDVAELSASSQARLARVLRDREVRMNGEPVATDFRLVAASTPGIDDDLQAHRLRSDLYRRVSAARIDLPSLHDRPEDIPDLAVRILEDLCGAGGVRPRTFTQAALSLMGALAWPGNLADLYDAIARVVGQTGDEVIHIDHVLPVLQLTRAPAPFVPSGSLRDARLRFEREYIAAVLQHHDWRMADAAETLGIQRPNLYRKARQLGIPLARLAHESGLT